MWPLQSSGDRTRHCPPVQAGPGNPVAKLLALFVHPGPPRAHPMGSAQRSHVCIYALCLMQEPNILQAPRGNSALLSVWWPFPCDPSWRDSSLWRMAGPSSQAQRQVPNDLPLKTALVTLIFSIKQCLCRGSSSEANEWLLKEAIFASCWQ